MDYIMTNILPSKTKLYPIMVLVSLLVLHNVRATYIRDDRFMSDVNLEHYYVIEENALSNADVLLREDFFGPDDDEEEDEHLTHVPNLTGLKSIISEAKTVHRLAGPDLEAFLAHPVNVYHLFRRLDNGWRDGLDLLLQTKPCKKWNLPTMVGRLRYLRDNLPGKQELERVVEYIVMLQKIHKLNAYEIAKGKIGDSISLKPLNIEDQFEIVKVLHDRDEMRVALQWLHQINDLLTKSSSAQREDLGFNHTDVLNMMATAYYELKNVPEALTVTEKLLEMDPTNALAKSSVMFFKKKLATDSEREDSHLVPPTEEVSKYERLCARKKPAKASKTKCHLQRLGLMFYKMEVIRYKPYVVIFHDVIRNKTLEILKNFGHEMQTEQAWIMEETFNPPQFNVELNLSKLRRLSVKREIRRLKRYVQALTKVQNKEAVYWGTMQIINVGLEGVHMTKHEKDLKLNGPHLRTWEAANFFAFLNDVKTGGDVVFPESNIRLHPEKGSVLFYYTSRTKAHSFCPVIGGSLWVAVQPMSERQRSFCLDEDEWVPIKQGLRRR